MKLWATRSAGRSANSTIYFAEILFYSFSFHNGEFKLNEPKERKNERTESYDRKRILQIRRDFIVRFALDTLFSLVCLLLACFFLFIGTKQICVVAAVGCYGWCTRKKHYKKELVSSAIFCSDLSERVSEWVSEWGRGFGLVLFVLLLPIFTFSTGRAAKCCRVMSSWTSASTGIPFIVCDVKRSCGARMV